MRLILLLPACAALAAPGCRPKASPAGPGQQPQAESPSPAAPRPQVAPPAREVVIGEMCPEAAGGRPAVLPTFVRKLSWKSEPEEVSEPLAQNGVRQWSVFGWHGHRAGLFAVAGSAEVDAAGDRPAAIGSYAGRPPCVSRADGREAEADPDCVAAQQGCGLAVGALEPAGGFRARPFGEQPPPVELPTSTACEVGGKLLVDIDGDEVLEAFPTSGFLGPVRGPAVEVTAVARGNLQCEESGFALRHVLPPGDPRHWRGLDLLGVIDLDGDGRYELVMSYHYSDRRSWAIYTAADTPVRLDLVGESTPWPRP